MMDEYPEAQKFYMERALQRRVEFRRRQKKFLMKLVKEEGLFDQSLSSDRDLN